MAVKRKPSSSAKGKKGGMLKTFITVTIIVVALAGIALAISYFYISNERQVPPKIKEIELRESLEGETKSQLDGQTKEDKIDPSEKVISESKRINPVTTHLDGTWVSTENGAMLTLQNETYLIDFPSVDRITPLKGHFVVKEQKITFLATGSDESCGTEPGQYSFDFLGKDLKFKTISDKCEKRSRSIGAVWFKL